MAFCEGGTLEDLLRSPNARLMCTARRLTLCAQVSQGLGYIAARRIVHRDIAARNVLLDSVNVCKVADYGMALSFADSDKEYVRVGDQLAVRWASIEVLNDHKFSVQSDVWAFGVLVWEVFSSGREPYSDWFDSLVEITNYIKEGGQLARPNEETPIEVFEELMLPCYHPDPKQRPSFDDLYQVAYTYGAFEDDVAMAELSLQREKNALKHRRSLQIALDRGDRSLLGPSVHHLTEELFPKMVAAVTPKWFRCDVTREEAEMLLIAAGAEGGFIVIENTIPVEEGFCLMVFNNGSVRRLAVGFGVLRTVTADSDASIDGSRRKLRLSGCKLEFGGLFKLIAHYMDAENGDDFFAQPLVSIAEVFQLQHAFWAVLCVAHRPVRSPRVLVPCARRGACACWMLSDCCWRSDVVTNSRRQDESPTMVWSSIDNDDPAQSNIWQMVHAYAKKASLKTICPRDGKEGCAYVDTLAGDDSVGIADALLSCEDLDIAVHLEPHS